MEHEDQKPPAKRSRSELEAEIWALKQQLLQLQDMMVSAPTTTPAKPAAAGALVGSKVGKIELSPEMKTIFSDAVKDVVWSKSPILHSELDRQKFAKAAAKATTCKITSPTMPIARPI